MRFDVLWHNVLQQRLRPDHWPRVQRRHAERQGLDDERHRYRDEALRGLRRCLSRDQIWALAAEWTLYRAGCVVNSAVDVGGSIGGWGGKSFSALVSCVTFPKSAHFGRWGKFGSNLAPVTQPLLSLACSPIWAIIGGAPSKIWLPQQLFDKTLGQVSEVER